MVGSWFRMFKGDRIIIKETLLGELVQQEMGEHRIELGMPMQNSDFFKDKMLLMQAQENGVVLDEEELLFLADVDDEPTAQSIFMANLSSIGPANLQVVPSNASILSKVHGLENNIDHCDIDQDEHEIHNEVQQKNIIDSNVANLGHSNVIPYEQYLSDNEVSVEPSCAPSVPIDASVLHDNNAYIPHDPLVTELSIYKQQVAMYKQRAKFDMTLCEQKMDEQMCMLIQDHNKKEENLKNELHSVKLQLNSTIKSNTIIEETVTALKHEFKQKETKFLTDFSNLKTLNDKLENKLYAQDQSIQTVHMMLKPKKLHNHDDVIAEVPKNPFLPKTGSQVAQPYFMMVMKFSKRIMSLNLIYTVTDSALSHLDFIFLHTYKCFPRLVLLNFESKIPNYQHLKENIENFKSKSSKDVPEFDTFFELVYKDIRFKLQGTLFIKQLDHFKAENEKVKQHYQELFNSIKVTRVKTIERTTSLQTEIENLKTQLKGKMPCVTNNVVTPKVSAITKYAIEVESIPASLKNNRNIHHHYLNRLRDILDTLREIVEHGRSKRPSDNSLEYACIYTKWKKHVTFADPLETSGTNPTNHVKQPTVQKTNVPIIHSKSNIINDKTLPANSVPEKKVEDHHRENKSKLSKNNQVDSSTSVRRSVFNTNSNSLCKTCNKCTISLNHDKSVVNSLKSSKSPPVMKIWRVKQAKQTWKPTGRIFPLGDQCPLTRFTKPKVVSIKQWKPTGRIIPLGEQCPLVRPAALNNTTMLADTQANSIPVVQIVLWYLDSGCSKHMTGDHSRLRNFMKKFIGTVRFGNDHFCAIMGYGDYVIGDSVIYRVYYVEGLGHNLFSVGQFCDFDLEVAFRKYTCFVRDLDGVDLIKEAIATACYTQNRSIIHTLHNKTPYELVHDKKPDLSFLRVFGALCYPTNDSEDLGKLNAKSDIGFFVGYVPNRKGYRIYNKRTRQIMETIHVTFDKLTGKMAPVHSSSGPAPNLLTPGPISSGLVPNPTPTAPYVPPTRNELEIIFQPMFDEYFEPTSVVCLVPPIPAAQVPVNHSGPSVSISLDQDAPSGSHSPSSSDHQSSSVHQGVAADHSFEVNPFAPADHEPFVNVFAPDPSSEASSSGEISIAEPNQTTQPHEHLRKWTDSHPIDNIIGNPSRLVSTWKQLATDALWCFYNSVLSKVEPKNFKYTVTEDYTMADVNAPAEQAPTMAPPTRTDDQILPRSRWVPVGKSNCYLDVEKSQSNPIHKIVDTVRFFKNIGSYSCQLDEQWFNLNKDTLRDALQIIPVDNNKPFSSPPTPDALINFVNDLGYPEVVKTLSAAVTNDMHHPWRALTTIINLCLTGKTSGFERPRAPVL
ncbi:retrovirus-related pol polyprotein from transposon TNT 1-94 [Tanacetum coccineum]|uniref:Retrovirus-related pol polyprotein from transposon TNT 1-94 n=1 Tax=Tanacetum coccineum TaxID=301880 RepID=A0ABQ5EAX7_9ASTR